MQHPKILFFYIIGLLTIWSCDNDDKMEVISIVGTWNQVDLKTDEDGDGIFTSVIEDCQLDNTMTFEQDETYIIDEGATKCHEGNPQTTLGTWILSDNDTLLSLTDESGNTIETEVLELTDNKLILKVLDFGNVQEDDISEITLMR